MPAGAASLLRSWQLDPHSLATIVNVAAFYAISALSVQRLRGFPALSSSAFIGTSGMLPRVLAPLLFSPPSIRRLGADDDGGAFS